MKKLFSLLVAGSLILGGIFLNKAEALEHFHFNGTDGQEKSVLFLSENLAYDGGYVMGVYYTGPETKLNYLGRWERLKDGHINIKYDQLKVKDENNRIVQERIVDLEFKVEKKNSSLRIMSQDAPFNMNGDVYNMHEYVWGNDKTFSAYMLENVLNRFGGKAEVYSVASSLDKLNQASLEIVNRHSRGPEGEGFWFCANDTSGNTIGTYYVESDPMAIYKRDGAYLGLIEKENSQPIPMEQRAAAINFGNNRARVIMYKERTTEYYDIYFTPEYFIVESVVADDPAVTKELQAEVGVRQEYGPNPRVNEVRVKLQCDR